MTLTFYSSLNLFFINLFTILVPRWLFPPFTYFWGGLFYLLLAGIRRNVRSNLQVVTGRNNVEQQVFSTFRMFGHNWCDVMLLMRLKGEKLQAMIGRRSSCLLLDQALATGIRSGMEKLLEVFERYIRAYPDQWYNFYDFFGKGQESDKTILRTSTCG
jgi:predicted LPLAT superfamily acyltransferase